MTEDRQADARVSISCVDLPLKDFVAGLAKDHGVSVVYDRSLDKVPVSMELVDAPLSDVLALVARRAGAQLTRSGQLFYLGDLRPEDRGVLVQRVGRLSKDELESSLKALVSEFGRYSVTADGLCVVADRVEVLARCEAMVAAIERSPSDLWCCEFRFVVSSASESSKLGVDMKPLVDVAAAFAVASAGSPSASVKSSGNLAAALKAELRAQQSQTIAAPLLCLSDGQSGKVQNGLSIPIPRRSVSNQGTTTTQGFEYVDSGFTLNVSLRRESLGARLRVNTELGNVEGYVESAPVRSRVACETSAYIVDGGVYLLGALDLDQVVKGREGPGIATIFSRDDRQSKLLLFARVRKVAAPGLK